MGSTGHKRLRVAFVDQTGDASGGAQESFALLLTHLPVWIEPRVLLFHDGKYAARLRDAGLDVSILQVSKAFSASKRERTRLAGLAAAPLAITRLARWLRAEHVDLVYTHTVKAHFVGAPAARLAGLGCVVHLRDILDGTPLFALRKICSACSRERIAISNSVARAYALPATTVVRNPLDLRAYRDLPSRDAACAALGISRSPGVATVGIVGRINRWKGHDAFVRIAAEVRRNVNARFLIVGDAVFRDLDFVDELHQRVKTLNLEDCITFVPWVDDVKNAYAALDVHVNCSDREPFGRSVIEAAACGVPTVCFSDAGVSEVLTDKVDGRVVPQGDEAAFAAAIAEIIRTPDFHPMSDAARVLAQRFDAGDHAAQVASILTRAAA